MQPPLGGRDVPRRGRAGGGQRQLDRPPIAGALDVLSQ
jgi:hypothetical protein